MTRNFTRRVGDIMLETKDKHGGDESKFQLSQAGSKTKRLA